MKPPCGVNCPDRHVGCQGKCEKYLSYRTEIDERKPKLYADSDIKDYTRKVKLKIALKKANNPRRGYTKDE